MPNAVSRYKNRDWRAVCRLWPGQKRINESDVLCHGLVAWDVVDEREAKNTTIKVGLLYEGPLAIGNLHYRPRADASASLSITHKTAFKWVRGESKHFHYIWVACLSVIILMTGQNTCRRTQFRFTSLIGPRRGTREKLGNKDKVVG